MDVNLSGKLNIKKRPLPEWLALFIFYAPFFFAFLQEFIGLPSFIKYTIDVAWISVTAMLFLRKTLLLDKKLIPFIVFTGAFIAYTFVVYLFNFQSIVYYLWGFRNNFRFYFAFIAFCMLFTEDIVQGCFKFLNTLFWINVVVSFFQFFVLGYEQDYLGGIFGVKKGCNADSIIFFTVILSMSVLRFMNKEEKLFACVAKCGAALIISAMAELKFFFALFVVILLMATILTSFSWQKFFLVFACALIFSFAGTLLTEIFGEGSSLSIEKFIEIATSENYSSSDDLGRFTAIPKLSNTILLSASDQLFGMGLGNCDTSSFEICNTPFYQIYSYLHYIWFSSAFLFLETGYVGLIAYLSFFVGCFVFSFVMSKRESSNKFYCQMSMIMSVMCVFITFYNASLRTETAYLAYFVLALSFIGSKADIQYRRRFNIHN